MGQGGYRGHNGQYAPMIAIPSYEYANITYIIQQYSMILNYRFFTSANAETKYFVSLFLVRVETDFENNIG